MCAQQTQGRCDVTKPYNGERGGGMVPYPPETLAMLGAELNRQHRSRDLRFRVRLDPDARPGYEIMVVDDRLRYARRFVPWYEIDDAGTFAAHVQTLLNTLEVTAAERARARA